MCRCLSQTQWFITLHCMSLTELYMFIVCLWLNCTCLLYVFDWTVHVYCMSLTELFMFIVCLWLNWSCLLHVKWEMSNLYDMYIVHMLPVKEKKNFYKEDKFSTWESFLYFVLCPEYLSLYVKQETVDQLFFVLNIHDYSANVHFYFFGNVMFLKIFKMLIFVVFYSTKCLSHFYHA
jgi:hypothetical protein